MPTLGPTALHFHCAHSKVSEWSPTKCLFNILFAFDSGPAGAARSGAWAARRWAVSIAPKGPGLVCDGFYGCFVPFWRFWNWRKGWSGEKKVEEVGPSLVCEAYCCKQEKKGCEHGA